MQCAKGRFSRNAAGPIMLLRSVETMTRYWVVGGEYQDTKFDKPVPGTVEQRYGPFDSHDEAKAKWQALAWATVDNAHTRYRIEAEKGREAQSYWVVGGSYRDTSFREPVGGRERWFGPFASYKEAKAEWQRHAWATVDDALSRFRIEVVNGPGRPPEAD